jgi:hypothetical protein
VGVALASDGERCTELHGGGAEILQTATVGPGADPARGDHGRPLDAGGAEYGNGFRHAALEIEARMPQVGDRGGAEVPARKCRVFQHDRVRHSLLALPLANDKLHAS